MTKPAKRSNLKTSVGGQAVMEGIMMRGPSKWSLAVRTPSGEVVCETHSLKARPWVKLPFIRGVLSFVDSIVLGYSTLMRSAELSMDPQEAEQEATKFDKWVERKFGDKGTKFVMGMATVLGAALAMLLFMFLPAAAVGMLDFLLLPAFVMSLLEGVIKIVIFVIYLALVSRMKEIHRVFSYHGAEHKTIYCYEVGEPLTVENIRKHSRFHPRCGTSFLLIVLIVSIVLNSALPWPDVVGGALMRAGMKLLMLPAIMGISYEILRLAGRHDNIFTRIISAPGMWLQRLTTKEPDDEMIEVAIAAVEPVLPQNPNDARW